MTETMTDAAPSNSPKPELQAWLDAWKTSIEEVLSVSGQPTIFEAVWEPLAAADSDLRYTITAAGAVQGEMALRLSPLSGVRLARKFIGEPEPAQPDPPPAEAGAPEVITDESREALEELLRQIAGLVATSVGQAAGGEVRLALTRAEAPWAWTSDAVASLRTRDENGTEIALEVRISPALAAALAARVAAAAEPASAPESPATDVAAADPDPTASAPTASQPRAANGITAGPASVSQPVSAAAFTPESKQAVTLSGANSAVDENAANYGRLLDVGLGVKLRFGTRRMALRDVLGLSSGLVVELDNQLDSPVDLLLDGRIIARGHVVVIDGKYGMRVTDVVDASPPGGPAL